MSSDERASDAPSATITRTSPPTQRHRAVSPAQRSIAPPASGIRRRCTARRPPPGCVECQAVGGVRAERRARQAGPVHSRIQHVERPVAGETRPVGWRVGRRGRRRFKPADARTQPGNGRTHYGLIGERRRLVRATPRPNSKAAGRPGKRTRVERRQRDWRPAAIAIPAPDPTAAVREVAGSPGHPRWRHGESKSARSRWARFIRSLCTNAAVGCPKDSVRRGHGDRLKAGSVCRAAEGNGRHRPRDHRRHRQDRALDPSAESVAVVAATDRRWFSPVLRWPPPIHIRGETRYGHRPSGGATAVERGMCCSTEKMAKNIVGELPVTRHRGLPAGAAQAEVKRQSPNTVCGYPQTRR